MTTARRLCAPTQLLLLLLTILLLAVVQQVHAQPESPPFRNFDLLQVATPTPLVPRTFGFAHTLTSTITYPGAMRVGTTTVAPLVAPAGSIIIFGNVHEVWVTTDGGSSWYIVSSATYSPLGVGPGVPNVLGVDIDCGTSNPFNNKLWMIGRLEDVPSIWFSNDGGFSWSVFQSWDNMYLFRGTNYWACTVDNNNTLWALTRVPWTSVNDGRDIWGMWSASNYPAERIHHVATSYYSTAFGASMIYIAGGVLRYGSLPQNDVYVSRDYGNNWVELTTSAPWPARHSFAFKAHANGLLVVSGGRNDATVFNDVWVSVDGGWSWWVLRSQASFVPRINPGITFDNSGYLWITGGNLQDLVYDGIPGGPSTDILRSTLSFSRTDFASWARLVNLAIILPGATGNPCTGLSCWPGESCRCSMTQPFDFRALPSQPWWGRYDHKVARLAGGFQYPVLVNGTVVSQVAPANSFVVFGAQPDTWISTNMGVTWSLLAGPLTQQATNGPYPASYASTYQTWGGQSTCYHSDSNTLYIVGGGWNDLARTTYRSVGGVVWETLVDSAAAVPTGFSYFGYCVAENATTVRLVGISETYVSYNRGNSWQLLPKTAYFPWRSNFVGSGYFSPSLNKQILYVMGGQWWETDMAFNDVWASSDGGLSWTALTLNALWPARADGEIVIASNGVITMVGGSSARFSRYFNDAFVSVDGGYTWFSLDSSDSFPPRSGAALLVDQYGYLSVWGGQKFGWNWDSDSFNSTYSITSVLSWVGSINPNVVVPPTGCTGLTCWPGQACSCTTAQPRMQFEFYRRTQAAFSPRSHHFTYLLKAAASYDAIDTSTGLHQTLTVPVNSFISFGGDGAAGDVWISTDRSSWRVVAGLPNDPRIPDALWLSFADLSGQQGCRSRKSDTFYLIAGVNGTTWLSHVYRSVGGVRWTLQSTAAGAGANTFPPRAYFICMVDSNENVLLTGGSVSGSVSYADRQTYVSTDQGVTFKLVRTQSYYAWRNRHFGDSYYSPIMKRDIFYVMGGHANVQDFNDVWASRDGGITWVMLTANADWPARSAAGIAITDSGVIALYGGYSPRQWLYYQDAWFSVDGGFNFFALRASTSVSGRYYPSLVFDEQGYLWVLGGYAYYDEWNTRYPGDTNDVYRSTLAFTDAAVATWGPQVAPNVVIASSTATGVVLGLRCWPGEACSYVPRNDVPPIPTFSDAATPSASSSSSSLSGGSIAGIVIGVLVGVVILSVALFTLLSRVSRAKKDTSAPATDKKWQEQQDVELSVNAESTQ